MGLKVVIACGGTGGHLFPGIAVAEALIARGHEPLLLISEKEIDTIAARDHAHLRFEKVPAVGMPPLFSPKVLSFAWKFYRTLKQTQSIVKNFGAHAVLGMGGFTSLPPAMAGRKFRAKTFIHESNAIPGKANRLVAKFCDQVLLGLADCAPFFAGKKTRVVGTPLRTAMRAPIDQAEAYRHFGLDSTKRTILVMGGSQGARGVNRAVMEALSSLDPQRDQIIHLTGKEDETLVRAEMEKHGLTHYVAAFSPRLDFAYSIAQLAIARSGASSLAELSVFGTPTILIPYPHAAEDHQTKNADAYVREGAAIMVREADLAGGRLRETMIPLLNDAAKMNALYEGMRRFAIVDAAEKVCEVIEAEAAS
jgi:UDP-N-acetylglucosamine--N-acetylmuramyl-(pentapeptide) pyrophosphoryl-undecaprenol N-acetylglucosamine transferase